MESINSDKFYSHFPSYNDENKMRQASLFEKQLEYEKNYIKLMAENEIEKRNNLAIRKALTSKIDKNNELNNSGSNSYNCNSTVIVPNRPNSTRLKLLQDLQHTDMSNLMFNDSIRDLDMTNNAISDGKRDSYKNYFEVGRTSSPAETFQPPYTFRTNKTDELNVSNPHDDSNSGISPVRPGSTRFKLLQDLQHTGLSNIMFNDGIQDRNRNSAMSEIEKKKIYQKELIKQIEEKRLQVKQIKEKERLEEEALNRKMEIQLRTHQLEEELEREKHRMDKIRFDSEQKMLMRDNMLRKLEDDRQIFSAREKKLRIKKNTETIPVATKDDRKVYKYFSNSARTEYNRRGQMKEIEVFNFDIPELDIDSLKDPNDVCQHYDGRFCHFCSSKLKIYEKWCIKCNSPIKGVKQGVDSRSHACDNCQRIYMVCSPCENINSICNICFNKRNVCQSCIKNVCIQCGYNVENKRDSMNLRNVPNKEHSVRNNPNSDYVKQSFKIFQNDCEESNDEQDEYAESDQNNSENVPTCHAFNDLSNENTLNDTELSVSKLIDVNKNLNAIKINTNDRLSRYMKNYGDLAFKRRINSRSTQTTPKLNLKIDNDDHLHQNKLETQIPVKDSQEISKDKKPVDLNKKKHVFLKKRSSI